MLAYTSISTHNCSFGLTETLSSLMRVLISHILTLRQHCVTHVYRSVGCAMCKLHLADMCHMNRT